MGFFRREMRGLTHHRSRKFIFRVVACIFGGYAMFSLVFPIFAAPPGSPYAPGETLNPSCAPGDANCTVQAPAVGNGTSTQITFWTTSSTVSSDPNLTWATSSALLSVTGLASSTQLRTPSSTITNLTFSGITGSTQCLQVNSAGLVAGSGSGCGSGSGTESGFRVNSPFVYLATSTDIVGIGATSTAKLTIQASNTGSSTLALTAIAGQTANLLTISSSTTNFVAVSATGTLTLTNPAYVNADKISTSTGANPSASIGLAAVNGTANTFMRSDAAPALDQSIAPSWTGFHQFFTAGASSTQWWSVSSTLTNFVFTNATGTNLTVTFLKDVNGNQYATSTGANPSATIGLTAVNGSANTFLRSDAAPALSQSIAPSWTGFHQFFTAGASTTQLWSVSSTLTNAVFTNATATTLNGTTTIFTNGTFTNATTTSLNFTNATGTSLALSGFTLGSIPFSGAGGVLSQNNSQFFWDNASNRLGIGTSSPLSSLSITGSLSQFTSSTLVLLGSNFITEGSASGTYLGINPVSPFNGDFLNFQVNSSTKFRITGSGNVDIFGLASSTEIRTPSSTMTGLTFTNATGTSLTITGTASSSVLFWGNATATTNLALSYSTASRCLRLDANKNIVAATGDCASGDTTGASDDFWDRNAPFVYLATSTDLLGIGATSTSKFTIQSSNIGSSTVLFQGLAAQTSFIFQVTSSTVGTRFFEVSSSGTVSVDNRFQFVNASGTNVTASGYVDAGTLTQGGTGVVLTTRSINTTSPLTGGGTLAGDLTIACATCVTTTNNLWTRNAPFTYLATSTDLVGIGATSTAKLTVQASNVGSSTALFLGIAGQTANLFTVASSTDTTRFFEILPGGQASSTEFRTPSSTITQLTFTNATGTSLALNSEAFTDLTEAKTLANIAGVLSVRLNTSSTQACSGTDKVTTITSDGIITCAADQSGSGTESGWRVNSPHVYLATSTDRVGVGATSTFARLTVSNLLAENATSSLLYLSPTTANLSIQGGSVSGTLLAANPSTFNGDFLNFQVNSSTKLLVNSSGSLSVATGTPASANALFTIATSSNIFTVLQSGLIGIGTGGPLDYLSFGVSPVATGTKALINLSNTVLSGGHASGTFIGANPATWNGDFIRLQSSSTNKFIVNSLGALTIQASSTLAIDVQDSSGTTRFSVDTTDAATNSGIDITAGASQTGNLLAISSSTGTVLAGFSSNARFFVATSTPYGSTSTLTVCALNNCTKPTATTSTNAVAFFASTGGGTTDASIIARGTITGGQADVGEYIHVVGDSSLYRAGDVLSVSQTDSKKFEKSLQPYDEYLVGVVTETAGLIAGGGEDDHGTVVLALAGRVPVKVNTENGPIKVGDLLTSSREEGVAMKAVEPGRVLGMALEAFDATSTSLGSIMVFINPHVAFGLPDPEPEDVKNETPLLRGFVHAVSRALEKLGIAVRDGVARLKELIAGKITAEQELCVGETCVTEEQFKMLLERTGVPASPPAVVPSPDPENIAPDVPAPSPNEEEPYSGDSEESGPSNTSLNKNPGDTVSEDVPAPAGTENSTGEGEETQSSSAQPKTSESQP